VKKTEKLLSARVLIFDIEISPLESFHWGLWDQNIALNQIKKDWHIMSWAAKWLDDKKVMYQDQRDVKDITNDKKTLEGIWKLLDEADVVITQNGKSFDVKKLNARFIMNGMQPPSSFKHIDTKRLATKHFGFTSNKLEYMAEKINKKFKKSSHKKFSGLSLWTECLKNNKAAWNEMKKYNIIDVLSTEELYYKLIPWDSTIDFSIYNPNKKMVCTCGSTEFVQNGHAYYASGVYKRYKCRKCGKEPKISRTKENRVR
jgi:hypothetical protein